ncbi:MAG: winged helix-turn-helix domain-containing protein [Woeseiaceae bacterium]|nr:winged helix-turn-helix domain-containing protein [Woeseiaceae bacterium]
MEAGFRLGDAEVRPVEGLVDGPAGRVRIEPKAMAVLVELARHAGEVCSREQIQDQVWPRGFTTDDVLTRCIGQIRKALGDDPKQPRHLETLPRRGYRLIHAVAPLDAAAPASRPAAGPASDSLIVLPFQYLSSDADDYLADGMTELLTARLASLPGIRVISRTTAMHFKNTSATLGEVASRTGAHWAIEGSIMQSGDKIQIVVQLVDARTDAHVWADDYLRDVGDMLVVQSEIVRKVASGIRLHFGTDAAQLPEPVTLAAGAMRDYLRGRHLLSKRTADALHESLGFFSSVIDECPDFAAGWASRAEATFMLCHYGVAEPAASLDSCRQDLDRALTLDPEQALGLTCRGALRFMADRDYRRAEADLLRALELLPGYSIAMLTLGNVCAVQGRFDDARGWLEQALLIDPLDVGINMNVGDHLILQRRYTNAVAAFARTLEIAPSHRPSRLRRCWALALGGEAGAAASELQEIGPADDADAQWYEYAALVAGAGDDVEAAAGHFEALLGIAENNFVSPWSLARAAAAANRRKECLKWLRTAREQRSTSFPFAAVTPAFDGLREEAAFRELVD